MVNYLLVTLKKFEKVFFACRKSAKSEVSQVLRELKANDNLFDTILIKLLNTDRHLAQNHLHLNFLKIIPRMTQSFLLSTQEKKNSI